MIDIELRLMQATKNRFRVYGMTECRTLFGEPCLQIAWGRLGSHLRRRSEMFGDEPALHRRHRALVARRRRSGSQESVMAPPVAASAAASTRPRSAISASGKQIALGF